MIRTFIAIPLPESVRAILTDLIGQLASRWPAGAVRWVKGDALHLTLRFLGDTEEKHLPSLAAGLDQIASRATPFELQLHDLGCFPHPRRPRVIWVGVEDPGGSLLPLQQQVERLVRSLGWERETRPFAPHLTLGRVRESSAVPGEAWLAASANATFLADQVQLIESQLRPTGAEYTRLHAAILGQKPPTGV